MLFVSIYFYFLKLRAKLYTRSFSHIHRHSHGKLHGGVVRLVFTSRGIWASEEREYSTPCGQNTRSFLTIHNISKEISEIIFRLTQTLALLERHLTPATPWPQQFPWGRANTASTFLDNQPLHATLECVWLLKTSWTLTGRHRSWMTAAFRPMTANDLHSTGLFKWLWHPHRWGQRAEENMFLIHKHKSQQTTRRITQTKALLSRVPFPKGANSMWIPKRVQYK